MHVLKSQILFTESDKMTLQKKKTNKTKKSKKKKHQQASPHSTISKLPLFGCRYIFSLIRSGNAIYHGIFAPISHGCGFALTLKKNISESSTWAAVAIKTRGMTSQKKARAFNFSWIYYDVKNNRQTSKHNIWYTLEAMMGWALQTVIHMNHSRRKDKKRRREKRAKKSQRAKMRHGDELPAVRLMRMSEIHRCWSMSGGVRVICVVIRRGQARWK